MTSPITPNLIDRFMDWATLRLMWYLMLVGSFDLLSTYIGICVLGGFELNIVATKSIQAIGYIPVALAILGIWFLMGYYIRWLLTKKVKNRNYKCILFAVVMMIVLHYSIVIPNNGMLLVQLGLQDVVQVGEPKSIVIDQWNITEDYVDKARAAFDRKLFCRVLPFEEFDGHGVTVLLCPINSTFSC